MLLRWLVVVVAAVARCGNALRVAAASRCRFCDSTFASRNAVFRHLREDAACAAAAAAEDPRAPAAFAERRSHAATFLVGYGRGRGPAAESALAALCSAGSATRAAAVTARGRSAALALGDAAAARDVIAVRAAGAIPSVDALNADLPRDVRVLAARGGALHAEAAATQRAFHFLLPLRWLDGGAGAAAERGEDRTAPGRYGVSRCGHAPRGDAPGLPDGARAALRGLKKALKGAAAVDGAWHNFADPDLRGLLSPFAAATRSRIHRARAAEMAAAAGEALVVVEIRGLNFLPQQARRLVGVAVLVQRGELPEDAFEILTRRDVIDATPLPPDLSYFAGARYGALERAGGGEDAWDESRAGAWLEELRGSLFVDAADVDAWLDFDARGLAERLDAARRPATAAADAAAADAAVAGLSEPPEAYADCLAALRDAHRSGKWPRTSAARSKLIRPGDLAASFTVARPREEAKEDASSKLPLGNALFPDLAREIFELEARIAPTREPSTRCAVNRRAAFAPHVDSGKGHGQSLSMIVGLGDYAGGELRVEEREADVRYAPLSFDGWRERHWTLPFRGERYSLVFFTPAESAPRSSPDGRAAALVGADFSWRRNTTDALAIAEVLGGGGCYGRPPPFPGGAAFAFDVRGRAVLDGGAHIGAFTEYALRNGAAAVAAFEPEPSNAAIFRENHPRVALSEAALVGDEGGGGGVLVRAESSGTALPNTWRHALEGAAHYANGERTAVATAALERVLDETRCTFVKLDIEGSELAILGVDRNWHAVERLVFEWSFTKDPALPPFRAALGRLADAGFACAYEGRGTWDEAEVWPGRTDALVFCARDL